MNCCDEYGNCNQGRDCPVRQKKECQWCHGTGYDASGLKCVCHPDHPGNMLAWIFGVFLAVLLVLMTVKSCAS
jgi:hypothetical protein